MATNLLRRFFGSAVSNAAGYGVGGAILPTLEPLTQDLANETWGQHPVKPLGATLAAEAAIRGLMSNADAETEAARTGYNTDRFTVLRRLAGDAPAFDAMLNLWRRGVISEQQLDQGLAHLGILDEWRPRVKQLGSILASPTDAVRFAVREAFDPESVAALDLDADFPPAFRDYVKQIGMDEQLARLFWRSHWELPSREEGAIMLHRNLISEQAFNGLLKALDYAPVWRQPLEQISKPIPPVDDMIRFAVREVYSPAVRQALGLDDDFPAEFAAQAALHGLSDEYARAYWAAHWRLPSPEQGFRMLHFGVITDAQHETLLRAQDFPPFWRDKMTAIAHIKPGRIDLKRMLRHGILTETEVEAGYRHLGYTAQDAARMREIAVAELADSETGSPWANRARSRLYTVAHNEFMDGSISEARARQVLGQVGASGPEITQIIAAWETENEIARAELTVAQVRKLYREGALTRDDAHGRLLDRGYTSDDADKLLDNK